MNNTARNLLGIAGACLVFVFGMVAGAAVTVHVERSRAEKLFVSGHLGEVLTERLTRRLTTRLHCDPHQHEEIYAVLLDAQREMREARRQITPQLRQVFFRSAERVRGILRGDQLKTFDEIMARIRERNASAETTAESSAPRTPPMTSPEVPGTNPGRR